jgi:hypothetical protein
MTHLAHQELVHRRMRQPNQVTVWTLCPTVNTSRQSTSDEESSGEKGVDVNEESSSDEELDDNAAVVAQANIASEATGDGQPAGGNQSPSTQSTSSEEERSDNGVAINGAAIGRTQVSSNKTPTSNDL